MECLGDGGFVWFVGLVFDLGVGVIGQVSYYI